MFNHEYSLTSHIPGGKGRIRHDGNFEGELNAGLGSRGDSIREKPGRTRSEECTKSRPRCVSRWNQPRVGLFAIVCLNRDLGEAREAACVDAIKNPFVGLAIKYSGHMLVVGERERVEGHQA